MSDNNEQVQALKAQVETLESRLKGLDEEKVQAQIATFEKACADKDAEITELKVELETANESVESSKKEAKEISEAKTKSDKIVAELSEKLEAIEAQSLQTSRISALVDKGVDKAEAESLVETFAGITDEQFEALVSKLSEAAFPWDKDKDKDDKKKKDKKDEDDSAGMKKKYAEKAEEEEAQADAEQEAAEAEVLEEAEAEDEPALATQSEDSSETIVASLNDYFSGVLGGNNNKEKSLKEN